MQDSYARTLQQTCFAREASSCDGSLLSLCIDDRKGKSVWFAEHWTID